MTSSAALAAALGLCTPYIIFFRIKGLLPWLLRLQFRVLEPFVGGFWLAIVAEQLALMSLGVPLESLSYEVVSWWLVQGWSGWRFCR